MGLFNVVDEYFSEDAGNRYRYVDDILLLYNGNSRQTKQLHQHINKLHRKLNFTLETEVNNSMKFLDLTITKTDTHSIYTENPPPH